MGFSKQANKSSLSKLGNSTNNSSIVFPTERYSNHEPFTTNDLFFHENQRIYRDSIEQ